MYKNLVVGFDIREMWLDNKDLWPQNRRNRVLLRDDVVKPLSVDNYVWYSVFSEIVEPRLWTSVARDEKYFGTEWNVIFSEYHKLSEPDGYRPRTVWRNLIHLREYLNRMWADSWKPCWLVSVIEVLEEDDIEDQESFDPITPSEVDATWQLLGYDVADYELITGLFEGEIDQNLSLEWGKYLNEYHLFTEPQKAFEYISAANKRYPSHMPYGVYALYLVDKHNTI